MMKRINLIELFVLVVFPQLSVAVLQMLSSCASSSYTDWFRFALKCLTQSQSTATARYESSHIIVRCYDDPTKFNYSLVASDDERVLENNGRNTDIVFLFDSKLTIYAKDNVNVLYSLDFAVATQARIVANHIISTSAARYKKCTGSRSYRVETVYRRSTPTLTYIIGKNWCIFKNTGRNTNVTTFMIKWLGRMAEHRDPLCVFRSTDYSLATVPDADNKLELSISLDGEILNPKYILESSAPDQMRQFFTR